MEYATGALAGVFAGIFTNPLDVVKTRLQLQGELRARGKHAVHYRNTLHAFYTIAKNDGIFALQKGLVPALYVQVCLNGIRLGSFDVMSQWGWTKNKKNEVSLIKTCMVSVLGGCTGSLVGSPFHLVKIHLQSQAVTQIAVGHQHHHEGMFKALRKIYIEGGLPGLWRGAIGSLPRAGVGSAAQLSTFSLAKEFLQKYEIFKKKESLGYTFGASMLSGVAVAVCMAPFDVVQTRLYNQGVDKNGKGLLYKGIADCFIKITKTEGLRGFFKGVGPCYLRLGPHSLLCLVFWDFLRKLTNESR